MCLHRSLSSVCNVIDAKLTFNYLLSRQVFSIRLWPYEKSIDVLRTAVLQFIAAAQSLISLHRYCSVCEHVTRSNLEEAAGADD
jgi:hypothetical protein